jgi:hypothetical protein
MYDYIKKTKKTYTCYVLNVKIYVYGETFVVFPHSNSKKKERKTSAILKKENECEIHTHDVCQTRTEKIVQMPKEIRWNFLVRHLYFLQILNYSQY